MHDVGEITDGLRRMPGGARLLDVLERNPQARLVGGAVRDLLLGVLPQEFDVVVVGDGHAVAMELGRIESEHPRFGTFRVDVDGIPCDVTTARAERYSEPGALPDVQPAGLDEDLLRRDFTVNTVTFSPAAGIVGAPHALEDLAARRLRILHERSFLDDPTRLWRLVRYAVRLGFLPTTRTEELAHLAVAADALHTVSAERRTAELRLLLAEPGALAMLHAAQNMGLLSALEIDPLVTNRATLLVEGHGSVPLTVLGSCITEEGWGAEFAFDSAERRILDCCATLTPVPQVPPARVSDLAAMLDTTPPEAIAVAGARGDSAAAHRWLNEWRKIELELGGQELIEQGVDEGPELGHLLAATRAAVLDGRVSPGLESELAFALGETDGFHEAGE